MRRAKGLMGRDEGIIATLPMRPRARLNLTPIFSHPKNTYIATGYESGGIMGDVEMVNFLGNVLVLEYWIAVSCSISAR